MNNIKLLYDDRVGDSEGIYINKSSASRDCDICHYWYFWNKGFKFQKYICTNSHDLFMMSINLSNIAISKIKGSDYPCIIR